MVKPSIVFQSTIGAALLSALLLSTSAHAGLLGGGGGAAGIGGGLNGAFTPRNLNLDGQVAGQASRNGTLLPSRDTLKDKAADTAQTGRDASRSTQADGTLQVGGALSRTAPGSMPSAPATAAATRRADASASGSGQVSRTDRSVNADASAQAGVQR